ncbi:HupE/UreJ family protein [bacterium]|nr:HupE/UreJ family protein [bacterium]
MKFLRLAGALLATIAATLPLSDAARGHGLEPALLALRERAPGRFEVTWKSSKLRLPGAEVRPTLPDRCRQTADAPQATDDGDRIRLRWVVDCGTAGLAGQTIGVADLDVATIDALLRIERLDGSHVETVLTAHHPSWTAPQDPTREELVRHFARLGGEAAIASLDRLLLLLGLLLLLAATPRRLLQAAAAFALGHAAAVALIGIGALTAAARSLDLGIAAAILFVALELTRSPLSARRRSAWLVGLLFGALSGAACATSLADSSAASLDAPLAVFAFTAGVALPQLAPLLLALAFGGILARRRPRAATLATRCAAYAMGILAVFWCLERVTA